MQVVQKFSRNRFLHCSTSFLFFFYSPIPRDLQNSTRFNSLSFSDSRGTNPPRESFWRSLTVFQWDLLFLRSPNRCSSVSFPFSSSPLLSSRTLFLVQPGIETITSNPRVNHVTSALSEKHFYAVAFSPSLWIAPLCRLKGWLATHLFTESFNVSYSSSRCRWNTWPVQ